MRYLRAPWTLDVALAVGIGALQLFGTYMAAQSQPDARALDVWAVLLLGGGALCLIVRRRFVVPVFAVAFVTTFAYELLDYPGGPIWGTLIVAFFTLMVSGPRWVGYVAVVVGFTSVWWVPGPPPSLTEAMGFAAWMLVLVAVTEVVRVRRAHDAELEQARVAAEERAQGERRLAIARDLHDVLAHNISLINVQASTALHLLDSQPEGARPALQAIKGASAEALSELRGVLEALREDAGRSPAPTLAQVGELTSRALAAGTEVETVIEGTVRPLPARVELAAFRICQEALTNVIRHAGPARARLRLAYGERELTVEVTDDGRGRGLASGGGGNGLPGMRERTAAIGGTLQAGPLADGGFRVQARLPL